MSYTIRLHGLFNLADSKKATDRKEFAQNLLDLLGNGEVCEEINDNSKAAEEGERKIMTWNNLFIKCHQLITEETRKTVSTSRTIQHQKNCNQVLIKICQLASTPTKVYLHYKDVLSALLEILDNEVFAPIFHAYITILVDSILPNRLYTVHISLAEWKNLMQISCRLYEKNLVRRGVALQTLQQVIHCIDLHSHLYKFVKTLLPFLSNVIDDIKQDPEVLAKPAFSLTYTICKEMAIEYRQALCEFSEKVMHTIISVDIIDPEKYKLLLLFIALHHPDGESSNSPTFYAHDRDQWRRIMVSLYHNILKNPKQTKNTHYFASLACEVFKQIIFDPSYRNDELKSSSSNDGEIMTQTKRRRLSCDVRNPLDLFNIDSGSSRIEHQQYITEILTEMIQKYPKIITQHDYPQLLELINDFFTEHIKNAEIIDNLCKLCKILLVTEKNTKMLSVTKKYWDKIWYVLVRILGLNVNEKEGHELLQYLIRNIDDLPINEFLCLYINNGIRWSRFSVNSLAVLCQHVNILDYIEEFSAKQSDLIKHNLINWTLTPSISSGKVVQPDTIEAIGKILECLTLITWRKDGFSGVFNDQKMILSDELLHDDRNSKLLKEILRFSKLREFQLNVFEDSSEKNAPSREGKHSFKPVISEKILNFVVQKLNDLLTVGDDNENVFLLIVTLAIAAKFTTNLKKIIKVDNEKLGELQLTFEKSFIMLHTLIDKNNYLDRAYDYIVDLIKTLITFHETCYHEEIKKIVIEKTPRKFFYKLFEILNVEDNHAPSKLEQTLGIKFYERIFEFDDYEKNDQKNKKLLSLIHDLDDQIVIIGTHKLITLFGSTDCGTELMGVQQEVLKNLMQVEIYAPPILPKIGLALNFLKLLAKSRKGFYSSDFMEEIVRFLTNLSDAWRPDRDAAKNLIEILPIFVEHVVFSNPDVLKNIANLYLYFYDVIVDWELGSEMWITFLRSLCDAYKIIPSLEFTELAPMTGRNVTAAEIAHVSLKNPQLTVRFHAINLLQLIYKSKDFSVINKRILFKNIRRNVTELFSTRNSLPTLMKEDDSKNAIATSVYAIGCIINSSGQFQIESLISLLELHGEMKIPIESIEKILKIAINNSDYEKKLVDMNLYSLMISWMKGSFSSQKFPWMLTKATSEENFYKTHMGILILIKLELNKLSSTVAMCEKLGYAFSEVIENHFDDVISWLLINLAADDDSNRKNAAYANEIVRKLKTNENEFENVKKLSVLIENKLIDILTKLIGRLHDTENFMEMFNEESVHFPRIYLPNTDSETLKTCLKFVEKECPSLNNSLIWYLTSKNPWALQQILLNLADNIFGYPTIEYKLKTFHQYAFFCDFLLQQIASKYFDDLAMFFLRDTCNTLLLVIDKEQDILPEIAAKYLRKVLNDSVNSRAHEIAEILDFIVTNLITAIQDRKIGDIGVKILEFIVKHDNEAIKTALSKLEKFPKMDCFNEIRKIHETLTKTSVKTRLSLKDDIETFLDIKDDKILQYNHDALVHLRKMLFEKKPELIQIYKDLEKLRGFAEDCKSSSIHRLIYKLVKLTESSNRSTSLEVAKCLGELGPANLQTMILHAEETQVKEENDNFEESLTHKIIVKLIDFICGNDLKLKKACANTLHVICSSSWSQKILSKTYLKTHPNSRAFQIYHMTRPFVSRKSTNNVCRLNAKNCKKYLNPAAEIWICNETSSYNDWIMNVSCRILSCFDEIYFTSLAPICAINIDFCEFILPKLIYLIITAENRLIASICQCIDEFFKANVDLSSSTINADIEKTESFNYKAMKCMLNIINFIRIQCADNFMLNLNYLHIAKAAQYCSAYFSSIFYAELYCENLKKTLTKPTENNLFNIDHVAELSTENGKILQDILRNAFEHIGDPDSIHGCGLSHLKDMPSRIQYYSYLQQWDKVLIAQDAELSSGNLAFDGMARALRNSGFDYLLSIFANAQDKIRNVDSYAYETAWRLSDWNISSSKLPKNAEQKPKGAANDDENFFYCHYQALKSLAESDNKSVEDYINYSRIGIIKSFHNISLECSKTLYAKLVKLQMLLELEQVSQVKAEKLPDLVSNWKSTYLPNSDDFGYVEPILSQRLVVCKMKDNSNNSAALKEALFETYLELAKIAKSHGHVHISARILISLSKENGVPEQMRNQLQYNDALLSWDRNDHEVARYLMKDLMNKKGLSRNLYSQSLITYGNWMAESKSKNPQAIIDQYYEKSINAVSQVAEKTENDIGNLISGYAALAQFSDYQYRQINVFMKTPQYESLKECAKYAEKVTRVKPENDDVKRALSNFHKQNTMDIAALKNIQSEQKMYLKMAIENYFNTLQICNDHNFFIFPIISLWLENKDNDEVNTYFQQNLKKVSAFKFIPLIPQLVPHISNTRTSGFKAEIYQLLKRCVKAHPHHTLPNLLALVNSRKDQSFTDSTSPRVGPNERELGAKSLIAEFKDNPKISPIIAEMEKLAEALIMLAYSYFDKKKSRQMIPKTQLIRRVTNFRYCVVPTITLNVQQSGEYDDIVSIHSYGDYFDGVGGVNLPKKVICIGTDGIKRRQLVKGKDDLKQDAVMQQLFTTVNLLLAESKETNRRKLSIRTYKIVPLSQRSGVLEWCDDTEPIITILTGSGGPTGLHSKYYTQDWSVDKCREKVSAARNQSKSTKEKVYIECCAHLHPVLHFYFMEKFSSPEVWFERRLAFTRSVATNSMVGYILGLGDRHFRNILLDEMTAEVIHIDFGIAFEQGKVLPVPETVPFRLTRNIESAMGILGIEGVCRRSCEQTMTVLRNKKDIIITLLQVLLYDPLFSWAITPAKAWELQSDMSENISEEYYKGGDQLNKLAERALLRIEQKLQGTEDGLPTSITGQVERLIQEARDPANLCQLFAGWQAYL